MNKKSSNKIFIADDHQLFIDGLTVIITEQDKYELVGSALDGENAFKEIVRTQPDIAILDINMPGMDGLELSRKIKTELPGIRIIILSMLLEYPIIQELIEIGIDGYIIKNAGKEILVNAINQVAAGDKCFSDEVRDVYFSGHLDKANTKIIITRREKDVLELISKGLSSKEICQDLNISFSTVETHRKHLMEKMKVRNVAEMVRVALENKLID